MELQLTITLSDRLFELLEDKLPCLGRRVEKTLTRELGKQVRAESEITVTPVSLPTGAEAEPETEAAPEEEVPVIPDIPIEECPTEEDIRKCIDRTRQRLIGEDYKTNPDSEAYKRYYSLLSKTFKIIAGEMHSPNSKPSTVPPQMRGAFIEACDELVINEEGEIVTPSAF